jgi:predicted AlkP superfamily pyrophosphatase or phosphodiesterase
MWTAPNNCVQRPQIWDLLSKQRPGATSAAWFPMHAKGCGADYVCTPAPIHNPDGSESLWCYTRPDDLYGTLRDELGHFPLQHFWGPAAGVQSSAWIADSALHAARAWRPNFFYVYLPHLDFAAQRSGPESEESRQAVAELDAVLAKLAEGFGAVFGERLLWIVAGEYAITPVDHVTYPNRVLREARLLEVENKDEGEHLDFARSPAWALTDHQFSHVFVNGDDALIRQVAELFRGRPGIDDVLLGDQLSHYGLDHARSGRIVLVSAPDSWQAYYWWLDDDRAPAFARTVDIHRKPGYDPVELFFDPATRSIPLDAARVRGSHGAPALDAAQRTTLLVSEPGLFPGLSVADTDVFRVVAERFGIQASA